MPMYHVYFDAVIHYSGRMTLIARTAEDAAFQANLSRPDVSDVTSDHITTFNVSEISHVDDEGNECFDTDEEEEPERHIP